MGSNPTLLNINYNKKNNKSVNFLLTSFKFYKGVSKMGKVLSVKDGVAKVSSLFVVLSGEMLFFRY